MIKLQQLTQNYLRPFSLYLWCGTFLCLPFSTALTSLFVTLAVIASILQIDATGLKRCRAEPIVYLCIFLAAWLTLSLIWTIAPENEAVEAIWKYKKLIYIPLLFIITTQIAEERVWQERFVIFFIGGCIFGLVGSYLTMTGLTEIVLGPETSPGAGWGLFKQDSNHMFYIGPPGNPTFGRNHITSAFFLTVLFNFSIEGLRRSDSYKRYMFVVAAIAIAFLVLQLQSRGGYILLMLSFSYWAIIYITHLIRNAFYVRFSASLFAIVLLIPNFLPTTTTDRINLGINEVHDYLKNKVSDNSSAGGRLHFYTVGITRSMENPGFGTGVGSFAEVYGGDERRNQLSALRNQPHSEFVNQLVQGGAVALTLYLLIFYQLINSSCRNKNNLQTILIVITFFHSLWNSLIWDFAEGHFFVLLCIISGPTLFLTKKSKLTDSHNNHEKNH